jgi:type IV secretory pathway TrbF-like protein
MSSNLDVEARRDWDERYADLVLGKRNWQIAVGGSLLLSLTLAGGMVWLISRSRYIPYVVEVDKLGYALTVPQPLTPTSIPDVTARMQRYEVAAFIRSARSVSSDPQVEHHMLNSLLAHARGATDRFLDAYFHSDGFTHNPFKLAEKQTVSIQIDSILQLSPNSYEVRWTEQQRDLNGVVIGVPTYWEAVLQTQIVPPPPLKLVTESPIEASARPPPPTGAQLLAQQPSEVQVAIKEHQQDGKWLVYRTARVHTVSLQSETGADRRLRAAAHHRHSAAAGRDDHRRCVGRYRALDGDAGRLWRSAQCRPSPSGETAGSGNRNQSDNLHDKAHLSPAPALARARDAGGRVLVPRRADRGDERCRLSRSERQAGSGRSAG